MNVLADTQILIWLLENNNNLNEVWKEILTNPENKVYASHISLFELEVKKSIGKLPEFIIEVEKVSDKWIENGFEFLPITLKNIYAYNKVPMFPDHKDPFDRFLVGVALSQNLKVMTSDSKFKLYTEIIELI